MFFYADLPIFFASALLLCFVVWPLNPKNVPMEDGKTYVTMGESILLIVGYIVYAFFSVMENRENDEKKPKKSKHKRTPEKVELKWWIPLVFCGSIAGIFFGAKYTIDSVIQISSILKIAKEIVAISAVSIGTSLPELMVSVTAVRKKKYDMAFGNVAGSNIFNIFAVVGIPGIYANCIGKGVLIPKSINDFALPFLIFTYLLFLVVMMDKKDYSHGRGGFAVMLCSIYRETIRLYVTKIENSS